MENYINYHTPIHPSDMPHCSDLEVTRFKGKTFATLYGELEFSSGYFVKDGNYVYVIGKRVTVPTSQPGPIEVLGQPHKDHIKVIRKMVRLSIPCGRTMRIRSRGEHARWIYTTKMNTNITSYGVTTNEFK